VLKFQTLRYALDQEALAAAEICLMQTRFEFGFLPERLEMSTLICRLLVALIGGEGVPYVRSPVTARARYRVVWYPLEPCIQKEAGARMARTPLSNDEKRRLLRQRIPDRMFEVHFCRTIIEAMERARLNSKSEATLSLATRQYAVSAPNLVAFIALDAGIMMCRALMNFLGIYFRDRPDRLEPATPSRNSDVYIGDFRPSILSVDAACAAFRGRSEVIVKEELMATLRTANIGIGHLTRTAARDIGVLHKVSNTCELVLALMNHHLYEPLGEKPVTFAYGSARRYLREV
jgi:hypothetical protein